jgi:hypothetical protein
MEVSRRQLFGCLALTAGCNTVVKGAEPATSLDALRTVSAANGINLSDDRLRVLKPVLEQRLTQLHVLRDFAVGDAIAPTQGILGK